jgi:putative DNA primase/helicase
MSDVLDNALALAAEGFRVFPLWGISEKGVCACGDRDCESRGKHPEHLLAPHGLTDATTDPDTIEGWHADNPHCNFGVVTGGMMVLDVDGDVGKSSLAKLIETHGPLPNTWRVATGRGYHIYLRLSNGTVVHNSVKKLAPGLDVRGARAAMSSAPAACTSPGVATRGSRITIRMTARWHIARTGS